MTTIERIRSDPRVRDISDERHGWNDNGFWVYLKNGFCWDDQGLHIIHEPSPSACRRLFREIRPCTCAECIKADAA
jgi:hypothetical protein